MPVNSSQFSSAKKIGVIRNGSLGEFFSAYPALDAIRGAYPKAEIVLYGDEWHQKFLADRKDIVDRVIRLPHYVPYSKQQKSKEVKDFLDACRKENYDLILQMSDSGYDTNLLVSDMGAAVTAGLAAVDAQPLDITVPYVHLQNDVMRCLEVVESVGINVYSLNPHFPVLRMDHAEYSDVYKSDGREFIILHPGANDPRRRWHPEFFAIVGDWLMQQGYRVIITSSIVEYEVAESVLYTMKEPGEAMVGVLSLPALMALTSKARMVICNDSGPLQVARAVGTPTVGLYWALNVVSRGPLFTGRHRAVVSNQTSCPVCNKEYDPLGWPYSAGEGPCGHVRSMLESITPENVMQVTETLLLDTVSAISL